MKQDRSTGTEPVRHPGSESYSHGKEANAEVLNLEIIVRKSLRMQLEEKKGMFKNMEKQLRGMKDH